MVRFLVNYDGGNCSGDCITVVKCCSNCDYCYFKRVKQLEKYPHSGKIEEGLQALKLGHRNLVVYNFKIIYRIVDRNKVYITDVFSTSQDPKKIIYRSKETDSDF